MEKWEGPISIATTVNGGIGTWKWMHVRLDEALHVRLDVALHVGGSVGNGNGINKLGLEGTSTLRGVSYPDVAPISGRWVALVARVGRLYMGEIGNMNPHSSLFNIKIC
ncbi:hypothetical protein OUZ56_002872 [Daphnia magna]|uniref:Uncharacterized protein n=1 Tax=Daphnia magna TaxID=35525 RepID=A0ABR0A712_9CRUS|nr:hypothetical protein OUZ56_002872 [Daphnia magna]